MKTVIAEFFGFWYLDIGLGMLSTTDVCVPVHNATAVFALAQE